MHGATFSQSVRHVLLGPAASRGIPMDARRARPTRRRSRLVSGSASPSTYWTIAKLRLQGRHVAASYHMGFRLVGNHVSAPRGDDQTGAIGGIDSADLFVLGNELTNIGYPGTSKLYHPMYIQSAERNEPPRLPDSARRQVAWNYLHDNFAFDGINHYREGSHSAYMTNTRVHDNVIVNQTVRGMLIGTCVRRHQRRRGGQPADDDPFL